MKHAYRADAVVHILSLIACATAVCVLWLGDLRPRSSGELAVLAAYTLGAMAMFGFSAAYNLASQSGSKSKELLQLCDHLAIFLMIAGTYSPTIYYSLDGKPMLALTAIVWSLAALGAIMRVGFMTVYDRVSTAYYLIFGWIGLAGIAAVNGLTLSFTDIGYIMMVTGGIIYSAGVVIYHSERLTYHLAIWHGAVLLAATIQFFGIFHLAATYHSVMS